MRYTYPLTASFIDRVARFFPDWDTFDAYHPELAMHAKSTGQDVDLIFRSHPDANQRVKWHFDKVVACASAYTSVEEFRAGNWLAYRRARDMGVLVGLFDYDKHQRRKWTLEKLIDIAKCFTTREDFKRGAAGAHFSAREQGLLDIVCQHMPANACERWTVENITVTAHQYNTKRDFRLAHPHGYRKAKSLNMLERLFG